MMTTPMPKSGADHGSPGQGSPDHASARPVCVEFSLRSHESFLSSETAIRHGGRTFALEQGHRVISLRRGDGAGVVVRWPSIVDMVMMREKKRREGIWKRRLRIAPYVFFSTYTPVYVVIRHVSAISSSPAAPNHHRAMLCSSRT